MSELTPKKVLLDAAEIVEQKWGKGYYWTPSTGSYCAVGSLMKAAGAEFVLTGYEALDDCEYDEPDYDIRWPNLSGDHSVLEEADDVNVQAYIEAQSLAAAEIDKTSGFALVSWNDNVATSGADVAALFRAAAAKLDD